MPTQIIGIINKDGVVVSGTHLHCVYDNDVYVVSFNDGVFSSTPVIIATVDTTANGSTYTASPSVHNAGFTGCKISVQNFSGQNIQAGINLFVSSAI